MGPAASEPLHSCPAGHLLRPPHLSLPGRQCRVVRGRGRHCLQVGAWGLGWPPPAPLPPPACPSPGLSPLLPHSAGPVSTRIPLSVDTIAVGLVSSVVVYPVYLVILFLFRMSRSKVGQGPRGCQRAERGLQASAEGGQCGSQSGRVRGRGVDEPLAGLTQEKRETDCQSLG